MDRARWRGAAAERRNRSVIMQPMRPRRFVSVALAAALLALAIGCGERQEPPPSEPELRTETDQDVLANMVGVWEGELRQEGMRPFDVRAVIRSPRDPRQSTVSYGGIDCSGTWTLSEIEGTTAEFAEVIDSGEGRRCKGSGRVALTLEAEGVLDYVFRGGGVVSRGTLTRTG